MPHASTEIVNVCVEIEPIPVLQSKEQSSGEKNYRKQENLFIQWPSVEVTDAPRETSKPEGCVSQNYCTSKKTVLLECTETLQVPCLLFCYGANSI